MAQYNGVPKLKQLAELKDDYRGKNENGGRKCFFRQSKEYKRRGNNPGISGITIVAMAWEGFGHTATRSWRVKRDGIPFYEPPTSPDHSLVLDKAA